MVTEARSAYGSVINIGDGDDPEVFTPIAEVKDISGPTESADVVEVTPHRTGDGAGYKERITTLLDLGTVTFDVNWIGDDAGQLALVDALRLKAKTSFQVLDPDGTGVQFSAYVTQVGRTNPVNGALVRSITLQPDGAPIDVTGS